MAPLAMAPLAITLLLLTKAREKNFANKKNISPYLLSPSDKTTFSQAEMQQLSGAGHLPGTWEQILGPGSAGVAHKLCARKMLMIDRVTHVMPRGGAAWS